MLEITSLPAKQGDAIWIRWGEEPDVHRIIVDMGTGSIGEDIRRRIEELPEENRHFDLLVITHVDADHIGGVLTCLAEGDSISGLVIDDIWFNGFEHLTGGTVDVPLDSSSLEPLGPVQGEKLADWLRGRNWNKAFRGRAVQRIPDELVQTITLHDGLQLSILGPTPDRLRALTETWENDVIEAIEKGRLNATEVAPGLEPLGSDDPPVFENPEDLRMLAGKENRRDHSEANGSSISLLLAYKGRRALLAGDAFSDDLIDGIRAVSPAEKLHVDIFKVPHHGSKKNVHIDLVEALDCDRWLVSTDGTRFKHPDAEAIARIIEFSSGARPLISFNVPSEYNLWWNNISWRTRYSYDVEYGDAQSGLTIQLEVET